MKLEEFIVKFADQFDDTDVEEITSETEFQDLDEWSSLIALAIIVMVKKEFQKEITGKEIKACSTVRSLYELIQNK